MIHFSDDFYAWSAVTFWVTFVSIVLTLGFTFVIFIGGLFDLRFLIRSLDEVPEEHNDDGRVMTTNSPTDEKATDA